MLPLPQMLKKLTNKITNTFLSWWWSEQYMWFTMCSSNLMTSTSSWYFQMFFTLNRQVVLNLKIGFMPYSKSCEHRQGAILSHWTESTGSSWHLPKVLSKLRSDHGLEISEILYDDESTPEWNSFNRIKKKTGLIDFPESPQYINWVYLSSDEKVMWRLQLLSIL